MTVCAVPRCSNPGTEYVQDAVAYRWEQGKPPSKARHWLCVPCLEGFRARAKAAGGPGYEPVDESDPASQLPLGAA